MNCSGSTAPRRPSFLPSIIVQYNGPSPRHRFTSASELCHLPQSFAVMCCTQLLCKLPLSVPFVNLFFLELSGMRFTSAEWLLVTLFTYCIALFLNALKERCLLVSSLILQVYLLFSSAPVLPSLASYIQHYISFQSSLFQSGCLALTAAPQSECRRTVQLVINAQGSFLWPECSESLKG